MQFLDNFPFYTIISYERRLTFASRPFEAAHRIAITLLRIPSMIWLEKAGNSAAGNRESQIDCLIVEKYCFVDALAKWK